MLKLFLPILFPSWRFFSSIGPSPRIDIGFVAERRDLPTEWIPLQLACGHFSFSKNIIRLFHNPLWNEQLFINTCAERLFEGGDKFYSEEIARRLLAAIQRNHLAAPSGARFMLFRIRVIYSEDAAANTLGQVRDEVFLQSSPYVLAPRDISNGT